MVFLTREVLQEPVATTAIVIVTSQSLHMLVLASNVLAN